MTALRITLAIVLAFGVGTSVFAQSPPEAGRNAPVASNLRIVSPQNGQRLPTNFVTIQYQVTNPAAAADNLPTFNVSLDGGDPVQTSTMSHTFTGLAPGQHTITVQMVDANSLPLAGTLAKTHFVVATPQNAPPASNQFGSQAQQSPQVRDISAATQQAAPSQGGSAAQSTNAQNGNLPSSGSALPLLSVIGFGVLVGGIASALKTR